MIYPKFLHKKITERYELCRIILMSTALKTQRMQAHHNDWPRVQKTGKTRKLKIKYLYLKHNKMKIKMMVS